jgi:hypothetical protein
LIVHLPVPGTMRTRAIASFRRPVPYELPVVMGLRTGASALAVDSVVYSEGNSSVGNSSTWGSTAVSTPVGSATVLL